MANIAKIASAIVKIELCREQNKLCWETALAAAGDAQHKAEIERAAKECDWHYQRHLEAFLKLWNATGSTERSREFSAALMLESEIVTEKSAHLAALIERLLPTG